jgi:uncharacterized protein YdaU (DUF1376 family)
LDHLYATEKPIPTEKDAQRICKCSSKEGREAVADILQNFFKKTRLGFTNKRFEQILREQKNWRKRQKRKRDKQRDMPVTVTPKSRVLSTHHSPLPLKDLKSSPNVDDLKKSILAKSEDPRGQIAAMLEIICERAERSGTTIRSEAYLLTALDNFDTQAGQDREELMQRMRKVVH